MASRFYFDSAAASAVNPAFGTAWNKVTNAVRRRLNATTQASASTAVTNNVLTNAAGVSFVLRYQFVIPDLSAQTISGSIKGQMRCQESATGLNATLAVRVAKCASDGSGVTEILAVSASDATTTPPEMATTFTNRPFQDAAEATSIALTSTAVSAGDCLIVEVGYRESNATGGRNGGFSDGDDSATDLGQNNTDTAANNPWIEFANTISFGTGGGAGNPWTHYAQQMSA